jgi:carbonic anhydrase/acetyltransferase-like protein (isoleucine patch superfamily)
VADGARLIGDVTLNEGASVWFNAVIRADNDHVEIGRFTNVQDNCTLHVDPGRPLAIGDYVTIGHNAVVHGCTIEDNVLIGMHATILNGAVVGRDSLIGAHALVPENAHIPPGSLAVGVPARVIRQLNPEEIERLRKSAEGYASRARAYREGGSS